MLKMMGKGTKNGRNTTLVVLGLSKRNIKELEKGYPILVKGEDIGVPDTEIMIFTGDTEQSMARELHKFIGPETIVNIDPRLRD